MIPTRKEIMSNFIVWSLFMIASFHEDWEEKGPRQACKNMYYFCRYMITGKTAWE